MVVPVIGYLIVLNSTPAAYLKLHGIESSQQSVGVFEGLWKLKLYLVYFGLMSLGVGSAIYQWKCPPLIKKYQDWAEYVAGVQPHTYSGDVEVLRKIVGYSEPHAVAPKMEDQLRIYLRMHYTQMSSHYATSRAIATILFGIGFALLSIPSAMTALRVASALAEGLGPNI